MKEPPKKKPAGRPKASKASLKTKPNISIMNRLQWEAMDVAERLEMGYSEWVTRAIERQIGIDQNKLDAEAAKQEAQIAAVPSEPGKAKAAAS